jgi:Mn-dependent DtxR family transcriptional regulator
METWKRFHEKELTHSMAHYLQAIATTTRDQGAASVSAIADLLGVSKAGVTSRRAGWWSTNRTAT